MNRIAHSVLKLTVSVLTLMVITAFSGCGINDSSTVSDLPEITRECKPWTYWWWMGSAVDRANITANLEDYSRAGIGGVHIIPIYGVKGYEDQYIPFLSREWMEMLAYTVAEANRLDMGVDMTTGTGWPYGGPNIGAEDAASMVRIDSFECSGGERFIKSFEQKDVQAILAFSSKNRFIDLTLRVDDKTDSLKWTAPEGKWKVYTVIMDGTRQQVKRAAPGAEGDVLDYFSAVSLNRYLARFDSAFSAGRSVIPRAFYNDSFEVYNSNWTDDFFDEFNSHREYDLRMHIPELLGKGTSDMAARVRHDYNETISDLLLDEFTVPWVSWCHDMGSITRNQAHGSPGNLLDLYAAADIPETEAFGPSGFPIPGLRVDSNIPEHFGKPEILIEKFASSAAHVTGKKLVSSESCTWLGEHFQVSLSQVKPEIDALLAAGVNHILFHGIAYSPAEETWPGWLFYASTNFGQTGSFWKDLPELNAYIASCQSFLQSGLPANDILLYWPVHDIWRREADTDMLHHFQVHNAGKWLHGTPFHEAASNMWERGFTFDYISDRLLQNVMSSHGMISTDGGVYRTIVVPGCRFMPSATLDKLVNLARSGSTVIVTGAMPVDVPGFSNLERERALLREQLRLINPEKSEQFDLSIAHIGKGQFIIGDNLEQMLSLAGAAREPVTDFGVKFIRRAHNWGYDYFLTNLENTPLDRWVTIGVTLQSAVIYDPIFSHSGVAALRKLADDKTQVYLQLEPGQSCILRTFTSKHVKGHDWEYISHHGKPYNITGQWQVTFVNGGPGLPDEISTSKLASWTEIGGDDARVFAGTARYKITFKKPVEMSDEWMLDLGKVYESARIWLNGSYIGALWCFPFNLRVGKEMRDGENILEVEVTNLAANRIADLDRRNVTWKKFHNINYVSIKYEPLDASSWPLMDSGLIGPVQLIPLTTTGNPDN